MTICFWNINKKNLSDSLIDLVKEQQIEILVLAEAEDETILQFLYKSKKIHKQLSFNQIDTPLGKLTVLSSFLPFVFTNENALYSSTRWDIYQINIPSKICINIVAVHFHSKLNWAKESLSLECVNLARDVRIVEKRTGCFDTILIGDFNMNPFEDGIVAANGLHAIQDLEYVSQKSKGRNIDGTKYNYFYNPMWNFFGDFKKPLGTHYCRPPGHISQEWNIYDQIMFRTGIKKFLEGDYVKIIDEIAGEKITKAFNRPYKERYSDHLPITLQLSL